MVDNTEDDTSKQMVDLVLLRDLLCELKVYIEYYELDKKYELRTTSFSNNKINAENQDSLKTHDDPKVTHILQRFMVLKPAIIQKTI